MSDIVIIGGGGAGMTAALKAKKTDYASRVTLVTNQELSYSPCALPFVVGGEIEKIEDIYTRIEDICKASNIECVIDKVSAIDTEGRSVKTSSRDIRYDKLIIATGARAMIPPIKGRELENIYTLYTIDDCKKVMEASQTSKTAAVIGGGAIGLETAVALRERGVEVTLIEGMDYVLCRFFDPYFAEMIESCLQNRGIRIIKGAMVEELIGEGSVKKVNVAGETIPADMVVMAAGVRPNVDLAKEAGIEIANNGILTNEHMETSVKDIYAAGDCTVSMSLLTGRHLPSLLGTTAVRQGSVAGANAVGERMVFEGVYNSMILKIFDLEIGRTGVTESQAKEEGMRVVSGKVKSKTTAEYYPGGKDIEIKLIFNATDGTLIGAQTVGSDVADKINLLTLAISMKPTVEEIVSMEYCYTPPLAPSHNPVIEAAENAYKKMKKLREREARNNS